MTPFRVVAADPPWQSKDKLPGPTRGAAKNYKTMSLAKLKAFRGFWELPVADDAWLFVWRLSSMQIEAIELCRAWGFEPYAESVWEKITKKGKRHFGMGRLYRASHEVVLVGRRGKAKRIDSREAKAVRSLFSAPIPVDPTNPKRYLHSAKPEIFYDHVETLVEGPYVELFARRQRPGWTCFGDQLPEVSP